MGSEMCIRDRMMAVNPNPQVSVVEFSGWDTHANQGRTTGSLANRLGELASGLAELQIALGDTWKDTAVVVSSEFGRTARPNGTGGTDHGTGGLMMLCGGAVNGGTVHGDWPGLATRRLYNGRDLATTTDVRSVLKGVLHDHFQLSRRQLDTDVFPDSSAIAPLTDLIG